MEKVTLKDKFLGCIAAAHIGSAMGAAVEGMKWEDIKNKYGYVEELMSYEHYNNAWERLPGTNEDGIERQKLILTAIYKKQDRVNAEDIRKVWLDDIKPESIGMVSEPFEYVLLSMAKSGLPARDIGKYCDYSNVVTFARSCHPVALINAGNIQTAVEDVLECGQLYQVSNSKGLLWACVTAVAIAEGTKPNSTLESVFEAIFNNCDKRVVSEIKNGLEYTQGCKTYDELRVKIHELYNGVGHMYESSYANEVVTRALCILRFFKGNTKDCITGAVNLGRDTDCTAAVAGGIAGALSGSKSIPKEWIEQVDKATFANKYTNLQLTQDEYANKLYQAFKARIEKMKNYSKVMDI